MATLKVRFIFYLVHLGINLLHNPFHPIQEQENLKITLA